MRDRSRAAAFLPLGLALSLCLGLIGPGLIALLLVWDEQRRGIPRDGQELLGAGLIAMFVTFVAIAIAPLLLVGMVLAVARATSSRAVIAVSVAGLSWLALALFRGYDPWITHGVEGLGIATAGGLTLAVTVGIAPFIRF